MTSPRGAEAEPLDVEQAVRARYTEGAIERQEALCCPVDAADPQRFAYLPREVIEKDYGCGDPTRHVREGDVVLDLGSGAGRVCFMASKIVGPEGRVIGVDMNDDMLAVARRHEAAVGDALGYRNVTFFKGRIQDLRLDMGRVDEHLRERPVSSAADLVELESTTRRLANDHPMVADDSVDLVVSNCVLNLVRDDDKEALIREIFRVLKRGGRIAISDIVVDEDLPESMKNDPELWSGCLSGAFREDEFLAAFERAGFHAIAIAERGSTPWRVVDGYEFRSVTVTARKGKQGPCLERNQGVIYRGPWKQVEDDDGHVLPRGKRVAVCDKTFHILTGEPYADQVDAVEPYEEIPIDEAGPFPCSNGVALRSPRVTKGEGYRATTDGSDEACDPDGGCC